MLMTHYRARIGFVRCINSFHAKNMCDSRIYEYLLPTYVLQPREVFGVDEDSTEPTVVVSTADASGNRIYTNVETGEAYTWTPPAPSTSEEMAQRRTYRIDPTTLERVRQALGIYEGTHNYHNYTCNKKFTDESAKRFILSFKVIKLNNGSMIDRNTHIFTIYYILSIYIGIRSIYTPRDRVAKSKGTRSIIYDSSDP